MIKYLKQKTSILVNINMMRRSPNKKVKNATPTIVGGIQFLSKLEAYTYEQLLENNIPCEYAKVRYEIIKPFVYDNEKVRAMTYKPDFTGDNFVIECKGHCTDAWKVRVKLIKRRFSKDYKHLKFYIVSSKKLVDEMIKEIKENVHNNKKNII